MSTSVVLIPGAGGLGCAFDSWPSIPIHVIASREDRCFPLELQQRMARDRLGVEPAVVPGGHLAPLSQPEPLTDAIAGYIGHP
jgi:pimeloyl-ACP methyl ester carboxylesterase